MSTDPADTSPANGSIPPEPDWVTKILRFYPSPVIAVLVSILAATVSCIFLIWACVEPSPLSWGCLCLAVLTFGWVAAASVTRFFHRRRHAIVVDRYASSETKSTASIFIGLIAVYSTALTIGLHVFRHFFAANAPGGLKYQVTLGISFVSSIYMALHGRRYLRLYEGRLDYRNVRLTTRQAVLVVLFLMLISAYFTWLTI